MEYSQIKLFLVGYNANFHHQIGSQTVKKTYKNPTHLVRVSMNIIIQIVSYSEKYEKMKVSTLSSKRKWTLSLKDGSMETFLDIRRKVGNQIIRIYLLNGVLTEDRIERINGSLRGPKNEFKDFAKYFILRLQDNGDVIRFLTETGIYENMRIVGTDSQKVTQMETEEIVGKYTEALSMPEKYNISFILNDDSEIIPKA